MSTARDELEQIERSARQAITSAGDLRALEEAENTFLARKARLNEIMKSIRDLSPEDKRVVGPLGNTIKRALEELVASRRAELERAAEAETLVSDRLDLTLDGRRPSRGAPNPLVEVQRNLEDVFVGMGYQVVEGPEVETDWYNFGALNFPEDHPSRGTMDSFFVTGPRGPEQALLRTHTSPVQIRVMTSQPPPIYCVIMGRAFRRDEADATHLVGFSQMECLAVDEGLTMADLKGTLQSFAHGAFGPARRVRLTPTFFPFTEPSAQLEVSCPLCDGNGCSQCASGWLEVGGAGMVDPNVFEACGVDPERYTGFAFGMGLERVAMLRFGLTDLRPLYGGDHRFLEQFRGLPVRPS